MLKLECWRLKPQEFRELFRLCVVGNDMGIGICFGCGLRLECWRLKDMVAVPRMQDWRKYLLAVGDVKRDDMVVGNSEKNNKRNN